MPETLIVLFEKQELMIILVFSQLCKQILLINLLSDFATFGSGLYLSIEFVSHRHYFSISVWFWFTTEIWVAALTSLYLSCWPLVGFAFVLRVEWCGKQQKIMHFKTILPWFKVLLKHFVFIELAFFGFQLNVMTLWNLKGMKSHTFTLTEIESAIMLWTLGSYWFFSCVRVSHLLSGCREQLSHASAMSLRL